MHEEEPARAAIRKARTTGRLDCTECWHACRQAAHPHCCMRSCTLAVSFALWKRCRRSCRRVRRVDLLHWPPADGYAVLACDEEATSIVKERLLVWCESPPTASIGTARERRHGRCTRNGCCTFRRTRHIFRATREVLEHHHATRIENGALMCALLPCQVGRGVKLGSPPSALTQKREGGIFTYTHAR